MQIAFYSGLDAYLSSDAVTYTVTLTDEIGAPICIMEGLELARHGFRLSIFPKQTHH